MPAGGDGAALDAAEAVPDALPVRRAEHEGSFGDALICVAHLHEPCKSGQGTSTTGRRSSTTPKAVMRGHMTSGLHIYIYINVYLRAKTQVERCAAPQKVSLNKP